MNTYIRHGKAAIEDIIPLIAVHLKERDRVRVELKTKASLVGYKVGVTSLRLRTFARDYQASSRLCCVACGLEATFFAIEADAWNKQAADKPHLNLYGIDEAGKEVLFTHDHILARGLGGYNTLANTQTMCSPCNFEKSKGEQREVERVRAEAKNDQ